MSSAEVPKLSSPTVDRQSSGFERRYIYGGKSKGCADFRRYGQADLFIGQRKDVSVSREPITTTRPEVAERPILGVWGNEVRSSFPLAMDGALVTRSSKVLSAFVPGLHIAMG